jgi:hypothetical protein
MIKSSIKSIVRNLKANFYFENEYICLDQNSVLPDISVIFKSGEKTIDVSREHLFLGYKPVIIAVPSSLIEGNSSSAEILFYTGRSVCGSIKLKLTGIDHPSLKIFEATEARHELLNIPLKIIHSLRQARADKNHPLYPDKNLYEQIRVAYAYPRKISVLVVKEEECYNVFPTDLHGPVKGTKEYVISLREKGKAYEQVKRPSVITLSTVPSATYRDIYSLGKNHMKELRSFSELKDLLMKYGDNAELALSRDCSNFLVLKKKREDKIGVHHLITFSIEESGIVNENADTLSHVHEYYASWRKRKGYRDKLLIRHGS